MEKIDKEDWKRTLREATKLLRDSLLNTEVFKSTVQLAEEKIKQFPKDNKEDKKAGVG